MQAAVVRNGRIRVESMPVPQPGPGEVLVRTLACGICGSDVHLFRHGARMMDMARSLGAEPDNLVDGLVMGHEFVAEVVAFGVDCTAELSAGARVCALPFTTVDGVPVTIGASNRAIGAYAEYFLLPETALIPIPADMPQDAAALTEPLAIGVHAVARAGVTDADVAVVIGCGPIGLACIAVLRERGVRTIIATDFSARRRELAGQFGAHTVLDARTTSAIAAVPAGCPAVIFECAGAAGLIGRIVREAPVGARMVVAGISSEEETFLPLLAVAKELTLVFVSFYQREEYLAALDLLQRGRIDWQSWITGRVGLAQVGEAFEWLTGSDRHAKILIEPGRE